MTRPLLALLIAVLWSVLAAVIASSSDAVVVRADDIDRVIAELRAASDVAGVAS